MRTTRVITVIIVLFLVSACSMPRIGLFSDAADPLREYTLEGGGSEKILLISVQGTISNVPQKGLVRSTPSMVQQVVSQLKKAEKDERIKAILFKINSPGGTIIASDILYHEISSYRDKTGAKIVVSMMDVAASGAYYLSLPADVIMAHPTTITGSIGVIFLRPKVGGLMDKIGLGVDMIKFGRNKDMGSPFRDSTEEEKNLMQKTVNDFGERFIRLVQKHRRLQEPAMGEISTARIFTADEALKLGLVDKIGYLSDAVKEAKTLAGLAGDARLVVYRRVNFPDDNYYNVTGAALEDEQVPVINIALPDSLNLHAGFYYLWPGAIAAE
ncbi:MAG: signal peptide peptidase SppA [Syntrophales bacterium]|nr:signal peptide peptidase SppA [Syntrophales bacterium]